MKFLIASRSHFISTNNKPFCFLDQETQANAGKSDSQQILLNAYNGNFQSVKFFDITTEQGSNQYAVRHAPALYTISAAFFTTISLKRKTIYNYYVIFTAFRK